MNASLPTVDTIATFLRNKLAADRYPADEQGGIFRASNRPVAKLGLLLEPFPGLGKWVADNALDALWMHRPWHADLTALPGDVGILHHHLPFDETLTMGFNSRLADQLDRSGELEPIGFKQTVDPAGGASIQRPIGMLLETPEREFDEWLLTVQTLFGGYDRAEAGRCATSQHLTAGRLAVVGAMNDELVREAANRGAGLYLTGQYRKPAQDAVNETGIAVVAVGHRRTEEWGLRALGDLLRDRWPDLTVVVKE